MSLFAKCKPSFVSTMLFSEGCEGPPDFTVRHKSSSLELLADRMPPRSGALGMFAPFPLGTIYLSFFPVGQPQKLAFRVHDEEVTVLIVTGQRTHNLSTLEIHITDWAV
jgi:hypothetical protein